MKRWVICLVVAQVVTYVAAQPLRAEDANHFADVIQPILKAKCLSCHGPEKQKGGLRLDSLAAAKAGGERGPAVIPGNVKKSLLVEAIEFTNPDLQMPPRQKLPAKEIDALVAWVKNGANWPTTTPANEKPTSATGDAFADPNNPIRKLFGGERLDLWSLKKPIRPTVPQVADSTGPIDSFLRARLTKEGLKPLPEADRRSLIRRLTFDLTGLPPTPAEIHQFLADDAPNAYERLVHRLLDSTRYGERQARLWLDVVRYADTNGYERDEFRPLIWQYRDYVIRSFNRDVPFDRFIREQLAGDEMIAGRPQVENDVDRLIATGFLRLGQWDSTASIFQEEKRLHAEEMADLTNTTASAFLGLTMSCCQCHDHKYDPLSQADHYRLRAFFAGVKPRNDLIIDLPNVRAEIEAHNAPLDKQIASLNADREKIDKKDAKERDALGAKIGELKAARKPHRTAMGAVDSGDTAPATHIFDQGDFASPREKVAPGFVSVLHPAPAAIKPPRSGTTGRRLALADWIASPDNPWTARVIVNRVWQQHFGVGLVATANDFGISGARPSHPELLDWLAAEFVERGWSVKELHRQIVTSQTYRQASADHPASRKIDADNKLLWRQNVKRLDAESLRDGMLAVSGLLRPYASGKPLWPPVPSDVLKAQPAILEAEKGGDEGRMQGWYADPIEQTDVRSIFLIRKRSLPVPFLQAFDLPDTTVSCARRDSTVVAPQALILLNSPEAVRYANAFAERIAAAVGDDAGRRVELAFQLALGRNATTDEARLAGEFLQRHERLHAADGEQAAALALTDFCRALLNVNEFAYVD